MPEKMMTQADVDRYYQKAIDKDGAPGYVALWQYAYYARKTQQNFWEWLFDLDPKGR